MARPLPPSLSVPALEIFTSATIASTAPRGPQRNAQTSAAIAMPEVGGRAGVEAAVFMEPSRAIFGRLPLARMSSSMSRARSSRTASFTGLLFVAATQLFYAVRG